MLEKSSQIKIWNGGHLSAHEPTIASPASAGAALFRLRHRP
jgi:hypothetical protein